jgi:uncharacterized tellurite resistance protein B-like protein
MLGEIRKFFDSFIQPDAATDEHDAEHRLRLATAALLIEVTRADHVIGDEELETVKHALVTLFDLSGDETAALVELAEKEARESSSHYEFTSLIKNSFDAETKTTIVEMLWRVVFADNHMDKYEEAMVRKIADLLYVSHRDFIAAKHRARVAKN